MKKIVGIILLISLMASCVRPHYLTREGKKKLKYYNDVYYGKNKSYYKNNR